MTSTNKSIDALLIQEVEGVEHLVYYLTRLIRGIEVNYSSIEHHCLALVFATQKLRHDFLAHPLNLVTRSNPLNVSLIKASECHDAQLVGFFNSMNLVSLMSLGSRALSDLLA